MWGGGGGGIKSWPLKIYTHPGKESQASKKRDGPIFPRHNRGKEEGRCDRRRRRPET